MAINNEQNFSIEEYSSSHVVFILTGHQNIRRLEEKFPTIKFFLGNKNTYTDYRFIDSRIYQVPPSDVYNLDEYNYRMEIMFSDLIDKYKFITEISVYSIYYDRPVCDSSDLIIKVHFYFNVKTLHDDFEYDIDVLKRKIGY